MFLAAPFTDVSLNQRILKNVSSKTDFNTDNKHECLLSSKSSYYNDFWRIMWHWRLLKIQLW